VTGRKEDEEKAGGKNTPLSVSMGCSPFGKKKAGAKVPFP